MTPTPHIPTTPLVAFHVMLKPSGAICNLDCAYCYYLSKERLYPDSRFRMSDPLLEAFYPTYVLEKQVHVLHIAWNPRQSEYVGVYADVSKVGRRSALISCAAEHFNVVLPVVAAPGIGVAEGVDRNVEPFLNVAT